jgi:hypothetical protein
MKTNRTESNHDNDTSLVKDNNSSGILRNNSSLISFNRSSSDKFNKLLKLEKKNLADEGLDCNDLIKNKIIDKS